ncbi:MAG: class I mannose-6-phosphate isomerase [Lachnospiraceae bacterium]|nr:class I mannose-6-phosphate isomerase [Lachnospiraceae bacterium]
MEKVILLRPYFSHTIWGGERLRDEFGYDEPGNDIGECWGISAHPSGESIVMCGEFEGLKLSKLWDSRRDLFGNAPGDRFPLLVKIIDARDDLSIQVHPDDEYASVHENGSFGKKECWYVLDCPEDGHIVLGHNAADREELESMIDEGRFDELIRKVKIRKGDLVQIDPGCVHAITAGVCVLETQQSSDITYRLYDYGRLQNGKPRELHLDKSKDVITVPDPSASERIRRAPEDAENEPVRLISCDRYEVSRVKVNGECTFGTTAGFICASVINGSGHVHDTPVVKGSHMLITAEGAKTVRMTGNMEVILSDV